MSVSGIEMRWGSGYEQVEERDKARELLHAAGNLAVEGLEAFGIALGDRRRMVVHKATGDSVSYGSATTAKTFHMYMHANTRWSTPRMQFIRLACDVFHELIHCKRFETHALEDLHEIAATEGLAYNAEYLFRTSAAPWLHRKGVVGKVAGMDDATILPIRDSFLNQDSKTQEWTEDNCLEWLDTVYRYKLSKAEIVGVHAVRSHLNAGRTIAELLARPASNLLGDS